MSSLDLARDVEEVQRADRTTIAPMAGARQAPAAARTPNDGAGRSSLTLKLRGLRAVVAVLDHGGVGRAANVLCLSQPAVTRSLSDLESELGFALFERTARGMIATHAGRILCARARRALAELARGCSAAIGADSRSQLDERASLRFAAMVGPQSLLSLLAIADLGSGLRAGDYLGRSQPTIHRHLVDLEHLVGVALFQRSSKGTRLTEAGVALLKSVKLALSEIASASDELAAFGGHLIGKVTVAGLPLSSGFLLPRALGRLLERHGDLQVTVVDGTYDALVQQLRCADIDMIIGALRLDSAPPDIVQEILFEDALSVIARPGHPCLAGGSKNLEELTRHPWLVPLPNTPARAAFERAFRQAGVRCPEAQLQVNSPSVVRTLLLESDRLALLSALQVDAELRAGQLVRVPLQLGDLSRTLGVACRREGILSPGSAALVEELRGLAAELRGDQRLTSRRH